jgi:hypothetical protein
VSSDELHEDDDDKEIKLRVVERGRGDGGIIGSLSGDRGGGDAVGSRQRRRKQKKRKGEGRMGGGGGSR